MNARLFKNPEVKGVFLAALLILVIFCGGTFLYFHKTFEDINKAYIDRNRVIVGTLVNQHPE